MKKSTHENYPTATVLCTGGMGFVISNVIRYLLTANPSARVISLDLTPTTDVAADYFSTVSKRLSCFSGDIRDRGLLDHIACQHNITHVVHGAMIAHVPSWEKKSPTRYLDVNLLGTVNLLEWARRLPSLKRFLYISSGAVYGDPTPNHPTTLQSEEGPFNPIEFYGITKWACEQIVRRYNELFPLETFSVRFGPVFGPMENPTNSRAGMSMPYHMMRALLENRPLRVTPETLKYGRDHISAEDAARAVTELLLKPDLEYPVYNVAIGRYVTGQQLIDALPEETINPLKIELVNPAEADVVMDSSQRYGRWNGYAIERIYSETGWQPRPLSEQMASYVTWIMANLKQRCSEN